MARKGQNGYLSTILLIKNTQNQRTNDLEMNVQLENSQEKVTTGIEAQVGTFSSTQGNDLQQAHKNKQDTRREDVKMRLKHIPLIGQMARPPSGGREYNRIS
jgi:hypothetical protein